MSSSNKRDNTDGKDNKKQKLDNNHNIGGREGEIDITNLSKQTIAQLKVIASSIGLSIKSGVKKIEIIEMIKALYKRKQEIIAKQEIDSNINSFNKGIIEYTIKDDIDESEWLFWKVFRNKFIYKRIMSFMDTHLSIPYDSITNVEKMIQSNQLVILRDKIVRNQYLIFGKNCNDGELLTPIFKAFRNSDDDILLYQSLFKHYSQYSMDFNNFMVNVDDSIVVVKENGRENLVNTLIESRCLPALLVLIQDYNYKPTIGNLNHAIREGSLKFIKLLLQPQFNLNGIVSQSESIQDDKGYSFKSLHYFGKENTIIFNSAIDKLQSKLVNFNNFEIDINKESKLKHLIIFCEIFLKSNLSTTSPNQSSNNNNNSVTDIEEIVTFSNSLTKQELKLSITDNQFHLVESPSSKKEFIKKLLDLYFNYTGTINKPIFYHLYFNNGNDIIYNADGDNFDNIMSFRFANFQLLDLNISDSKFKDSTFQDRTFSIIPHCLFSNCQNDKSKQMEFINQAIGLIKSQPKLYRINQHMHATIFFYLVIGTDDLDQIKYVSNGLSDKILPINNGVGIARYIKSTLVLNWLFENHLSHFTNNDSIWFFKNVQLLQHFQQLYSTKFGTTTTIKIQKVSDVMLTQGCPLINYQVLKHIFKSGPMVYEFDIHFNNGFLFISKCFANQDYSCQDKLEICKLDYLNYNGEILMKSRITNFNFFGGHYEMYFIKFLDWLYLNHNHKIKEIAIQARATTATLLFRIGRYNDESVVSLLEVLFDYKDNIGILDLILNNIKSFTDFYYTDRFLETIVDNGRLKSIEYIQQHHNWILKPKSTSNPNGMLSTRQLNQLLTISFKNNNLKLSEFLFHLFTLSKKDYKSRPYSANVSMVYFKDKNFK